MTSVEASTASQLPSDYDKRQWKYVGYRGFSDFLASDTDFLVLRRFGGVAVRAMLALQDELAELEEQLETFEKPLMQADECKVHNGTFREETQEVRVAIMGEIQTKLRAYYDLVNQYSQIRSKQKAPQKDINSVSRWLENHPNAILDAETGFISQQDDLFRVTLRLKSPLRAFLERSSRFRSWSVFRKRTADGASIQYLSDWRINAFVSAVIIVVGLAMLIAPLWILNAVSRTTAKLGVITAFICVFLVLVNLSSRARPFETLAATAGYAAVLVVFLQFAS